MNVRTMNDDNITHHIDKRDSCSLPTTEEWNIYRYSRYSICFKMWQMLCGGYKKVLNVCGNVCVHYMDINGANSQMHLWRRVNKWSLGGYIYIYMQYAKKMGFGISFFFVSIYSTFNSSTSKVSVAFGGMTPGWPRLP